MAGADRLSGGAGGLFDDNDLADLGDVLPQVAFDAEVEGHVAGGASDAGTVEPDVDRAVGFGLDELDVAAVGLDGGADRLDDLADSLGEGLGD